VIEIDGHCRVFELQVVVDGDERQFAAAFREVVRKVQRRPFWHLAKDDAVVDNRIGFRIDGGA
jgi:hypothetical protein